MAEATTSGPAYRVLADGLRERILSGGLRPGDRLPTESELCETYGVSRSTVREALRVLTSERLLVTRRGVQGGSFVATPQPGEIAHLVQSGLSLLADGDTVTVAGLLEVRAMLEVPAAGLAAIRHDASQMSALQATLVDPVGADPEALFVGNRDFHLGLLRATGNPVLEAVATPIFGVVHERFARRQAPGEFWEKVDRDHRDILDRVRAGDEAGAREAQAAHLGTLQPTYEGIDRDRRAKRDDHARE